MIAPPPRALRTNTPFPGPPLFRSCAVTRAAGDPGPVGPAADRPAPDRFTLQSRQLGHALAGQPQQGIEGRLLERLGLGRRLDLDDATAPGEDEVGIGLAGRILGIVEIEHRLAAIQAAGDRRPPAGQRPRLNGPETQQTPTTETRR